MHADYWKTRLSKNISRKCSVQWSWPSFYCMPFNIAPWCWKGQQTCFIVFVNCWKTINCPDLSNMKRIEMLSVSGILAATGRRVRRLLVLLNNTATMTVHRHGNWSNSSAIAQHRQDTWCIDIVDLGGKFCRRNIVNCLILYHRLWKRMLVYGACDRGGQWKSQEFSVWIFHA